MTIPLDRGVDVSLKLGLLRRPFSNERGDRRSGHPGDQAQGSGGQSDGEGGRRPALGDLTVKVVEHPATGAGASNEVEVTVEKK